MLQLDLPTLNVFTKIDQIASRDPLPFNLDFYTDAENLDYLLPHLEAEQRGLPIRTDDQDEPEGEEQEPTRFHALSTALLDMLSSFSLLSFHPLYIEDKATVSSLLHAADLASGYAFGKSAHGADESVWSVAVSQGRVGVDVRDVQERWIDRREEMDEMEREEWRQQQQQHGGEEAEAGVEDSGDGMEEGEDEIDAYMRGDAQKEVNGIKVRRVKKDDHASSNG